MIEKNTQRRRDKAWLLSDLLERRREVRRSIPRKSGFVQQLAIEGEDQLTRMIDMVRTFDSFDRVGPFSSDDDAVLYPEDRTTASACKACGSHSNAHCDRWDCPDLFVPAGEVALP
jgi:hypothetical protein